MIPQNGDDSLFLDYIDAEEPDIEEFASRAKDPAKFRARVRGHERLEEAIQPSFGRYQLVRELGAGGMGTVYLAHDPELGRRVALKLLRGSEWARNEARSLARISHPNVVEVYEVGDDYFAMEYVDGRPLRPQGTVVERLELLIQIADALAFCHARGVLSRDVKPANVLVDTEGKPRLIDFGLAHLEGDETTQLNITQSLIATPAYMAPEQIESGETGASELSDQFSFGVMAYEVLTGRNPFLRKTRSTTLAAITRCSPDRPTRLPRDLQNILLRMLELRPERRYAAMSDVRDDLTAVLELRPVSVSGPNPMRYVRRYWRHALVVIALLLAAFVRSAFDRYHAHRMPIESPYEVAQVLGRLADRTNAERIRARFSEVEPTPAWGMVSLQFEFATGTRSGMTYGRVYLPEGEPLYQQVSPNRFHEIPFASGDVLYPGYFRCAGFDFRKLATWEPAITIEESNRQPASNEMVVDAEGKPLFLTWSEAQAYARARGGRLPMIEELLEAGIERPENAPTVYGEWVGDYAPELVNELDAFYRYDGEGEAYFNHAAGTPRMWHDTFVNQEEAESSGIVFRIWSRSTNDRAEQGR